MALENNLRSWIMRQIPFWLRLMWTQAPVETTVDCKDSKTIPALSKATLRTRSVVYSNHLASKSVSFLFLLDLAGLRI